MEEGASPALRPLYIFRTTYHKDGTPFWVELSIVPVADAKGWFTHWVSLQRDVTHRHQASQELVNAKNEAERANLAKSEFLSRMSHELRTPLNAILGFSQLLQMSSLDAEDADCAHHILKAGRHLLALINEVLDIARIESGHVSLSIEAVAIAEVVSEAFDLVRNQAAERNIVFDNSTLKNSAPTFVLADRQRFTQIMVNLLSNAVKYNHEGGSITVACQRAGENVAIEVTDTGLGIAADQMGRLFTPFERLGAERSEVEGTGVGLALSKRLAEAMNGVLEARSELGQGTTFRLLLPPGTDPLEKLNTADATAIAPNVPTQATILYIEDNPSNLKLVQRLLARRPGVRLLNATRGDDGLKIALSQRPDLILLDLDLPGLHGRQVLDRLRSDRHTFATPVIIISADATPGQIERLLTNGADAFLTKPFDIDDFLNTIDIHLAAL